MVFQVVVFHTCMPSLFIAYQLVRISGSTSVDAEFSDNYIVLEPAYYLNSRENRDNAHLLSQIEDIKAICGAIPDGHIRKYNLCDVVNDIHFAKVVNFSVYALALVHGWLHCNHSLDVETLKQSLVELGYGIDTTH
jgi:hypothetical protein